MRIAWWSSPAGGRRNSGISRWKESDPAVARRIAYMDESTKDIRGGLEKLDAEMTREEAVAARKKAGKAT